MRLHVLNNSLTTDWRATIAGGNVTRFKNNMSLIPHFKTWCRNESASPMLGHLHNLNKKGSLPEKVVIPRSQAITFGLPKAGIIFKTWHENKSSALILWKLSSIANWGKRRGILTQGNLRLGSNCLPGGSRKAKLYDRETFSIAVERVPTLEGDGRTTISREPSILWRYWRAKTLGGSSHHFEKSFWHNGKWPQPHLFLQSRGSFGSSSDAPKEQSNWVPYQTLLPFSSDTICEAVSRCAAFPPNAILQPKKPFFKAYVKLFKRCAAHQRRHRPISGRAPRNPRIAELVLLMDVTQNAWKKGDEMDSAWLP